MVMKCVADGPEPAKNGAAIAARLIKDPDGEIRGTAARVLAMTRRQGPPGCRRRSARRSSRCSTIPIATCA